MRSPAPGEQDSHGRPMIYRAQQTTFKDNLPSNCCITAALASSCCCIPYDRLLPRAIFFPAVVPFVNILHLEKSTFKPFIYSFRMAIVKDALKKLFRRRDQNHIDIIPVQANKLGLSAGKFVHSDNTTCRGSLQQPGNLSSNFKLEMKITITVGYLERF